ncbi:GNAT family N-acetyltransferase [Sporosarcina sp. PTS2304]|uniref:GNAT family N-acetyltransferase n=1 Tax=Sporosarcina sp. PTS2304 TaxID=2283194 RepID=UPI000E0DFD5E|nr:GNAT family N-acetyltransferase [Sporosarcina sp. PTS2304]AXI00579.1 GNAT family N-acetyltransferase [Sporosarcina sp. PTS2304]
MSRQAMPETICLLTEEWLPEIMKLQEKVLAALETPELLQPLTEKEFLFVLQGHGMIAGAFVNDQLVAIRAMLDPGEDEEHLGVDAGVSKEQLAHVLYSEISEVDPAYRGRGLQTTLGKWLMDYVNKDRYHYICATVAPFNIPSLKDKFALGLRIVALKVKYGNKLRYIFLKDLQATTSTEVCQEQRIVMGDIEQQQHALVAGWVGRQIENIDGEWYVIYVK